MIGLVIDEAQLQQLIKNLGLLPNEFLQDVVQRSVPGLQEAAPKATSNLARSARPRVWDGQGEVLFDTNYAGFVHDGRPAGGDVDFAEIEDWVKLKGLPEEAAFPIAQSIKRKGTKPNPWINDFVGSVAMREVIQQSLVGAMKRVLG